MSLIKLIRNSFFLRPRPSWRISTVLTLLSMTLWFSCNTIKPYYGKDLRGWQEYELPDSSSLLHTVYLAGDGGDMTSEDNILSVMNRQLLQEEDSTSSIVFLGDNIYLHGLPAPSAPDRSEKEAVIRAQMDVAAGYSGNVIFIPGNHDWDYSGPDGLAHAIYQEQFVENYFNGANVFRPNNGCAGPDLLQVNEDVVLITLNSEWWIHPYEVPRAPENGCLVTDKTDFVVRLETIVRANADKHILIVAHHPVISNGNHGGHYNLLDHIFPLRLVRDNLYIPLPIIGSIYPFSRKLGVSPQDIPNTEFQRYKQALLSIIENRPNVIYATGHDHNLQLNQYKEMHHIVSGSASKTNFAARGFGADYVQQQIGFARVKYYKGGEVWVEYFIVNEEHPDGQLTFRKALYTLDNDPTDEIIESDKMGQSTVSVAASSWKKRSFPASLLVGNSHYGEWTTPVDVSVFQPADFDGGIRRIEKSGAENSVILRMETENDNIYHFDPIERFPRKGISPELQNTFLEMGIREQSRANHPYGELITSAMEQSLNVITGQPSLYYLPFGPYLGQYVKEFGGSLVAVRRIRTRSHAQSSQAQSQEMSSRGMIRLTEMNKPVYVARDEYLKIRLLDILTGNWDRNADDWIWYEIESDSGSTVQPVSKRREILFPEYEGIVPWLMSRSWSTGNIASFTDSIRDITAYMQRSAYLDQRILGEMNWSAWEKVIEQMELELNPSTIDRAVKNLPSEVYSLSGEEIEYNLNTRIRQLPDIGRRYYQRLNRAISVTGSVGNDVFTVEQVNHETVEVRVVYGGNEETFYLRRIILGETRELRLYGLAGDDLFQIDKAIPSLTINVIPGDGENKLEGIGGIQTSTVRLFGETEINSLKVKKREANEADGIKNDVQNDFTGFFTPSATLKFNPDDDLLLGAGIRYQRAGFRRNPAKLFAKADFAYATATGALIFDVQSALYSVFGNGQDLLLEGHLATPYVFNYFGEGQNSENERGIDYYRIPVFSGAVKAAYQYRLSRRLSLSLFGAYSAFDVRPINDEESILDEFPDDLFYSTEATEFFSTGIDLSLRLVDREVNPEKGFDIQGGVKWNKEISSGSANYWHSFGSLSLFVTPNLPVRTTFAFRIGFASNSGDYYFYQSNFLDGLSNLRGYRRTRFAGESVFYMNNEIRFNLLPFRNELIHGTIGAYAFMDMGKVWDRESNTGNFQHGYGPGIYFQLMDKFIWRASIGFSGEGNYFQIGSGFLF